MFAYNGNFQFDDRLYIPETQSFGSTETGNVVQIDRRELHRNDISLAHSTAIARLEGCSDGSRTLLRDSQQSSAWLVTTPSIVNFDRTIINFFITLFLSKASSTFLSFAGFCISRSTYPEEVLAIAAVGGLYSPRNGSHTIAQAMCSDTRRMLLTRVRWYFTESSSVLMLLPDPCRLST